VASRLQDVIQRGLASAKPAATTVAPGTLYFSTDSGVTERSDGSTWQSYGPTSFGGADFTYAGNPQGNVTAAIGQTCRDTTNGGLYVKLGGAGTAWGWYRDLPTGAGLAAAVPIVHQVFAGNDSSGSPNGIGVPVFNTTSLFADSLGLANHYASGQTNSSTGTQGGWNTSFQVYYLAGDFDFVAACRTHSVLTDARLWVGIGNGTLSNSDNLPGRGVMFRYSQAVDAGWVGYSHDGTTGSVVAVGAIATSTEYKLRIRLVRATNTLYFSINDGAEVTKTTNVPDGTAKCGLFHWCFNKGSNTQVFYYRNTACMFGA